MKCKSLTIATLTAIFLCGQILSAQEAVKSDAPMTIKTSADLELFYENSKNISGSGVDDKIKSNQLYINVEGASEDGYKAKVMLDGADIVGSDGKVVTEKIVEVANFTVEEIAGSPVTICFGKDEQPFGLDYDKYLNDSITHQFEIDKVWGINATLAMPMNSSFAAGTYKNRHSLSTGQTIVNDKNSLGDNVTARFMIEKLMNVLDVCVSASSEEFADVTTTDAAGVATIATKDAEQRIGAGFILNCPKGMGNINVEYVSFSNLGGNPDYNPGLWTLGMEYKVTKKVTTWGRYEIIDKDTTQSVETGFWSVGVQYSPVKNYTLMAEYSNFNSGDMSDATDLIVADGSTENALLLGVRAKF